MTTLGTVSINEGKVLRLWFEVDQFREPTQVSPDTSAPYTEDDKEGQRFTTSSTGEQVTERRPHLICLLIGQPNRDRRSAKWSDSVHGSTRVYCQRNHHHRVN